MLSVSAQGVTLAALVGGETITSGNGSLTFSDFEVTKIKRLSGNLELYTVTATADGITLTSSEFTANTGGLKKLDISYKVTANAGLITGATLAMQGTRETGRIKIEKDIDATQSDAGTFLLNLLKSGSSITSDSDTFSPGEKTFDVDEQIRIKKVSSLASVTNSYTVVAEPGTLSLLVAGLGGLAWIGRRRPGA
jgi:hypothetical protein